MTATLRAMLIAALISLPLAAASAQTQSRALDTDFPRAVAQVRGDDSGGHDATATETPVVTAEGTTGGHGVAARESEEEKPGLLNVDMGMAVWTIVVFLLLLAILGKFAWGPILKGLQDREGKIRHDLEHAENSAKQATATLEEYRAQLAAAHEDVRKIIDQGRDDAQRLKAQLTEQTQAEIDSIRKRAQAEIRGAKEQAINEIVTQTTTMVTDVAAKVLRRQISLNPDDQRRLVEDSLAAASHLGGTANN